MIYLKILFWHCKAEIKRLQEANKAARKERQLLLKQQEEIERMRNSTFRLRERLKCAGGEPPPVSNLESLNKTLGFTRLRCSLSSNFFCNDWTVFIVKPSAVIIKPSVHQLTANMRPLRRYRIMYCCLDMDIVKFLVSANVCGLSEECRIFKSWNYL